MNKLQSLVFAAGLSVASANCGQPLDSSDLQAHKNAEVAATNAESRQNVDSIRTACAEKKEQCLSAADHGLAEAAVNKALEKIACERNSVPGCNLASTFVYNHNAKEWSKSTVACTNEYAACLEKTE